MLKGCRGLASRAGDSQQSGCFVKDMQVVGEKEIDHSRKSPEYCVQRHRITCWATAREVKVPVWAVLGGGTWAPKVH